MAYLCCGAHSFELVGDSMLKRLYHFANQGNLEMIKMLGGCILFFNDCKLVHETKYVSLSTNIPNLSTDGRKTNVGLCIGGQTMDELCKSLCGTSVNQDVILQIGTNDLLLVS